jgi:hypothetical protein
MATRRQRMNLEYRRAFDPRAAQLFVACVSALFPTPRGPVVLSPRWAGGHTPLYVYSYPKTKPESRRWSKLCKDLSTAVGRGEPEIHRLWQRFWKEPLPLADLELAARQRLMLDKGVAALPYK